MSKRVLLVETTAGEASFHQIRLANAGYTVKLITSAAATLSAAQAFGPDLVVLDVDLLERSGMDVASWMRAASPTPLLLLVRHNAPPDEGAQTASPVGYLTKPITAAALLDGVNYHLRPSA
jgi:two-component system response regulator MprA